MSVSVVPVTLDAALHVSRNMRDADWRELSVQRFGPTRDLFAHEAVEAAKRGPAAVICVDGEPVLVGGVALCNPNTANLWMWATPKWTRAVKTTARVARAFIDAVRASGVQRVQALSHAEHAEAHKWIRFFGLRMECHMSCYGSDGSDFILFAEVS